MVGHLRQCCSNHVVVMNVRAERLCRVEPHVVNEIEVTRGELGRVRAEVERLGPPAAVVHDEPNAVQIGGLAPFPWRWLPARVGPYEVVSPLSRGGMGKVSRHR